MRVMFQVSCTQIRQTGDANYYPSVYFLFTCLNPVYCCLLCKKHTAVHKGARIQFASFFILFCNRAKHQVFINYSLARKTSWKPSAANRLRSQSSLLVSLTLSDYLASAFKVLIEPRALPRSAISGSFLLPVRENAREVQRRHAPLPVLVIWQQAEKRRIIGIAFMCQCDTDRESSIF